MEPKSDEQVRKKRAKYGEQDAWGNQVGSIRENLRRTPLQRLQRAQEMANFVAYVRTHARRRTP